MRKALSILSLAAVSVVSTTGVDAKVKVDAMGQFIEAMDLEIIFDSKPGSGIMATGEVCMSALVVKNHTVTKSNVKFDTFDKTGKELRASAVEVLAEGESLNILDHGEAGDNVHVYRLGDPTDGGARLTGTTGGDCEMIDVVLFKPTATTTVVGPTFLGFKQGNDTIVRLAVDFTDVKTDGDNVQFGADIQTTTFLGTGWGFPPE